MGPIETILNQKLSKALTPAYLELQNESAHHGLAAGVEKHFRLVVASDSFAEKSRLERHRIVHAIVAEELAGPIHALSVQAFTPEEWTKASPHSSPECAHKS